VRHFRDRHRHPAGPLTARRRGGAAAYYGDGVPVGAGRYITCPDAAALDITGDLELVAYLAADNWANGSSQAVVAKQSSGTERSYYLDLTGTGLPSMNLSANGSAATTTNSSAAVGFSAGQAGWVKSTWRQSDGRLQFFTAAGQLGEPPSWTQLGTDRVLAVASIWAGTSAIEVGSRFGGSLPLTGKVYRAIIRSGVGGTTVADFNSLLSGPTGYTDAYGRVWTIVGA